MAASPQRFWCFRFSCFICSLGLKCNRPCSMPDLNLSGPTNLKQATVVGRFRHEINDDAWCAASDGDARSHSRFHWGIVARDLIGWGLVCHCSAGVRTFSRRQQGAGQRMESPNPGMRFVSEHAQMTQVRVVGSHRVDVAILLRSRAMGAIHFQAVCFLKPRTGSSL